MGAPFVRTKVLMPAVLVGLLLSTGAGAAEPKKAAAPAGSGASARKPGPPGKNPHKTFTRAQIRAECKRLEGRYISYYGRVYRVAGCRREEIPSPKIGALTATGVQIQPVSNDTIIMIPDVPARSKKPGDRQSVCQRYEGQYMIRGGDTMYYVQRCRYRQFPDYETFADHRRKNQSKKTSLLEPTTTDMALLREGRPFLSVMDAIFKKEGVVSGEVDVIPVDEACEGVDDQFVTYYARIYRVQNCRKREVEDAAGFMRRHSGKKLPELSSEQWLSLPDGKPWKAGL